MASAVVPGVLWSLFVLPGCFLWFQQCKGVYRIVFTLPVSVRIKRISSQRWHCRLRTARQGWRLQRAPKVVPRGSCEMLSTNTEGKELYLHLSRARAGSGACPLGRHPASVPEWCLGESSPGPGAAGGVHPWGLFPRAAQMGPNLLAGGRKADCRGASLGPWPWLFCFPA